MSTRSDIIVHRADGKWARIYCHWDGYLDHNGKILFEHYTTQKKVEQLVALGDISVLGPEIGKKHPFDAPPLDAEAYEKYQKKYGNWCRVYGRDRGETGTEARVGDSLAEVWPEADTWTEFTYVWEDGKWWVGDPDEGSQTLVELGAALRGEKPVTPLVKAFGGLILGRHKPVEKTK